MIELRCKNKKHGSIVEGGVVEVKCSSRFCGARKGIIVLHKFHPVTGVLLDTTRYKEMRK